MMPMRADLLVVLWEEADLRTSVYGPSNDHPTRLVLLEAPLQTLEITWHPFDFTVINYNADGLPTSMCATGNLTRQRCTATDGNRGTSRGVAGPADRRLEEAQAMIGGAQADGYQIKLVA